ncbi:putative nuclease HARBI1 [Thrips palmi]|uniref:Nuclease HARBI1 n=1 Tax=Thrips palmi TaxID=161013 RepID=A0A6P8YEZ6_THRPL|nr:putative nuclease HARBI1 [Thrips palmi]
MEFDYFGDRPHNVALEHRRRLNLQIHERFRIRDNNDPLQTLSVTEFVRLYRIPQHAVVELANVLRPYFPQRRSPHQIPLIRKILVALSFYGVGPYQRLAGRSVDCSVSQTSSSRIIREVTLALNHPEILTQYIRFPLTHEERAPVIQSNERLGMPRVLGFMDGFLQRVSHLPKDGDRQSFFCRKGFTALNVQIICDADLRIMNVDARWPGSLTDNTIWTASAARNVVEHAYWEDRCWLLGDSGYYTAPWLHIPLIHAAPGTPEYVYTRLHCHCRNAVERCIGVLKERWRLLSCDRCINYGDAGYAGMFVNACCVLHNFCIARGVPNPRPRLEREPPVLADDYNDLPENIRLRGLAEMQYLIDYANQRENMNAL